MNRYCRCNSCENSTLLRQPGGVAFDGFDGRIRMVARHFEDFHAVERSGALLRMGTSPAGMRCAY